MELPANMQEDAPKLANISLEINELKEKFPSTPDLYREACALLFFRYGVTPTANKLYQLVRRGSMGAPSEALRKFWENLRDKSRVRIAHPDLPPELADTAGELIGGLWQRAQAEAERGYADARRESEARTEAAQAQALAAETRAETAALALFQLQAEFSANLTRFHEIDRALAREQGARAGLEQDVASLSAQCKISEEGRIQAGKDFETRLEAQRAVAEAAQALYRREIEQARVDVGRERTALAVLQRDLVSLRETLQAQADRHAQESASRHSEIARLNEALRLAQGTAAEARAANQILRRQLDKTLGMVKPGPHARRGKLAHRFAG